jgi:hypothetical protein
MTLTLREVFGPTYWPHGRKDGSVLNIVEVGDGLAVVLNNVTHFQATDNGGAVVNFLAGDKVELNPAQTHVLRTAGQNFQARASAHVWSPTDAGPPPDKK